MLSMMHFLFCLLSLLHCAVDGFVVGERNADARVSTVYHFPNNTVSVAPVDLACRSSSPLLTASLKWVENLAVRSNGKILATLINVAQVWQIDPTAHSAELVHEFEGADSILGIAEYDSDVFAVVSAVSSWNIMNED
jgi:hypothetical protein